MDPRTVKLLVAGAAVAAVGVLVWRGGQKVGQVLSEDLNPTSDRNLAYRGVNGVGSWLTGDPTFDLGGWVYDMANRPAAEVGSPTGGVLDMPVPADVGSDHAAALLARWIIDNFGNFEASKWVSIGALVKAWGMPEGSGVEPDPRSGAGMALLPRLSNIAPAGSTAPDYYQQPTFWGF